MASPSFPAPAAQRLVLVPPRLAERLQSLHGARRFRDGLTAWRGELPTPEELREATGLVLWHHEPSRLCSLALDHAPHLEWVHSLWTGLEHLPLAELLQRRTVVSTGRGVAAGPLAEWAVLAVLWAGRRVAEIQAQWATGGWEPLEAIELAGSRVVVLGFGSVGRAVARRLVRLGADVIGVRRKPRPTADCARVVPPTGLLDVCRGARALVVAVPLTGETRGLVDAGVLRVLADGAVVVNVGRGAVIVEEALLAEVRSGRLSAALDVWWEEPVPAHSPWRGLPNLLPSPHGAYLTAAFRDRHAARVAENIGRYLEGRPLVAVTSRRAMAAMLGESRGPRP